jgi:hypothetical protein
VTQRCRPLITQAGYDWDVLPLRPRREGDRQRELPTGEHMGAMEHSALSLARSVLAGPSESPGLAGLLAQSEPAHRLNPPPHIGVLPGFDEINEPFHPSQTLPSAKRPIVTHRSSGGRTAAEDELLGPPNSIPYYAPQQPPVGITPTSSSSLSHPTPKGPSNLRTADYLDPVDRITTLADSRDINGLYLRPTSPPPPPPAWKDAASRSRRFEQEDPGELIGSFQQLMRS